MTESSFINSFSKVHDLFRVVFIDVLRCSQKHDFRAGIKGLLEFDFVGCANCHQVNFHLLEKDGRIHIKPHIGRKFNHSVFLSVGEQRVWIGVDKEVHTGSELFKGEGGFIIYRNEPVRVRFGDERCRGITKMLNKLKTGNHLLSQYRVDLIRLRSSDTDFYHRLEFVGIQRGVHWYGRS